MKIFYKTLYILVLLPIFNILADQPQVGVVIHGLNRGGTMFIHSFFKEFCKLRNITYFSINSKTEHLINPATIRKSFVIAPFRFFDAPFPNNIQAEDFKYITNIYHIYQIRDPRDILVSEYFSMGWTHPTNPSDPKSFREAREWIRNHTIDEYVLKEAPTMKRKLSYLVNKITNQNEYLVKYEDMVLNFELWIDQVLKPFADTPSTVKTRLYNQFANEFNVTNEVLAHKRKVTPEDYKDKLQPETIEYLNELFKNELELFNYST